MQQNNIDQGFKKKRQQMVYNIRKKQRDQKMRMRRNIGVQQDGDQQKKYVIVDQSIKQQLKKFMVQEYCLQDIPMLAMLIKSNNILEKHQGVIGIRRIVCKINDCMDELFAANILGELVLFMKQNQYRQLKLEASWTLANMLNGNQQQCQQIINHGTIPIFVEIVQDQNFSIAEQGLWALGNLAADKASSRDQILKLGGLKHILKKIQTVTKTNQLKIFAWSISNLCRGKPQPDYDIAKQAVPYLAHFIKSTLLINTIETLSDCLWALSYLSDGAKIRLQRVIQTGVLPKLSELILHKSPQIYVPALRILGNCSTSNQGHTNALIQTGFLNHYEYLLNHPKKLIRKEVTWMISNIAVGTPQQAYAVLSKQPLIHKLANMLKSQVIQIKVQVIWIFVNFGRTCDPEPLITMYLQLDLTNSILQLLTDENPANKQSGLDILYKYLRIGQKLATMVDENIGQNTNENILCRNARQLGIGTILESLQYNQDKTIYQTANKVLERFFDIQ